jgi:hypothetical protein
MRRLIALVGVLAAYLLSGCMVEEEAPIDELFPADVGEFGRISGPTLDLDTSVDISIYQGPIGVITLSVKRVGAEQVDHALNELPPLATNVAYDPALGQRDGIFFTFGEEYHAAWGNGDWVFVLSAQTEAERAAFLSAYGY